MAKRGNTIHIPDGYYTKKTLAAVVGVSPDTINRWRELGHLDYYEMPAGKIKVYLFDREALAKARVLAGGEGNLTDRTAA